VQFDKSLIASVSQAQFWQHRKRCSLNNRKSWTRPAKSSTKNLPSGLVDHYLLSGCAAFLATVVRSLFFLTLNRTFRRPPPALPSKHSDSCFLPGKRNLPECISSVSTPINLHTADSLRPQLVAMWNWVRYSRQYSSTSSNWSSTLSLHCPPVYPCGRDEGAAVQPSAQSARLHTTSTLESSASGI